MEMSDQEAKDQKNKESVAAMKSAQAHMKASLDRIEILEKNLERAANNLAHLAQHLPDNLYFWTSGSLNQVSARAMAKSYEAEARKYL